MPFRQDQERIIPCKIIIKTLTTQNKETLLIPAKGKTQLITLKGKIKSGEKDGVGEQ